MRKEEFVKESMKCSDLDVDIGNGIIQHLKFLPTKDFYDGDTKLFGVKVKKNGRKLIVIIKIYEESRRKEILEKSHEMANIVISGLGLEEIDKIHIVDAIDVLDQMSKYKITGNSIVKSGKQKLEIPIEVVDIITGEMVPMEFNIELMKVDNRNVFAG